jgi:hypothetical protein
MPDFHYSDVDAFTHGDGIRFSMRHTGVTEDGRTFAAKVQVTLGPITNDKVDSYEIAVQPGDRAQLREMLLIGGFERQAPASAS